MCWSPARAGRSCWCFGSAAGSLSAPVPYGSGGIWGLAAADINHDGLTDAVFAPWPSGLPRRRLGNGDGTFGEFANLGSSGVGSRDVALADLNADGNLDLVAASAPSTVVLLGPGYTAGWAYPTGSAWGVTTGDYNADGKIDVVVGSTGNTILLMPGVGDGRLLPGESHTQASAAHNLATGDFNGDGLADLCVSGVSFARVLRNTTPVPRITAHPGGQAVPAGQTAVFSVAAASTGSLTYRWRRDGVDLADGARVSGASTSTLMIAAVEPGDFGAYDVRVSAASCRHSVLSAPAALSVTPCYPNCDGSTQAPILNVQDFSCFLTRYAGGCP